MPAETPQPELSGDASAVATTAGQPTAEAANTLTSAELVEQLTRRVRMLSRLLERAENEAHDLRRSGTVGPAPDARGDDRADELQRRVDELQSSTSWKVTRPLRGAKELSTRARPVAGRLLRRAGTPQPAPQPTPVSADEHHEAAFSYFSAEADDALLQSRLRVVCHTLGYSVAHADDRTVLSPSERLEAEAPVDRASWWLIAVGHLGSPPPDDLIETLIDDAQSGRPDLALARLRARRAECTGQWQVTAPLVIVTDPFVDATFAATTSLHTGVQRVVRNVVPFWAQQQATLAVLDPLCHAWRAPAGAERHRLLEWDDSLIGSAASTAGILPSEVLVPWHTVVVVPELKPKGDLELLRAMARSTANELCAIVYDLIPVSAGEYVPEGVTASFGTYISMIKHTTRVSAISASAGDEFRALDEIFHAQGIAGPAVLAQSLPIVPPPPVPSGTTAAELIAGLRRAPALPLVLQVGSIGPHKNQRATLQAATTLWNAGAQFEVVFVAPNSWDSGDFAERITSQQLLGRAVSAVSGITEDQLWALYREAHVVVLPSFVEGYGLPLAEALSVGTPVITSDFGSMAEIADGNGALLVSPGDHQALAAALATTLDDTERYGELVAAATAVRPSSWGDYAAATWAWLTRGENAHEGRE